jgi:adenylyltransferase/sulfurtransferase
MSNSRETYFQRQLILPEIGIEGFEKLQASSVLVIGAGGLGCPVIEQLSSAGVGRIGIVDGDTVQYSNLHRQSLYTEQEIGEFKVFCASKRILERNPHVRIEVYPQMLQRENALKMIGGYDIVVDCSDNYSTRYLVNDACVLLDKPFVYGAIYRLQGQVALFNQKDQATYRCLTPEFPDSLAGTDCVNSGVISIVPSIIANFQALETIKWITGIPVIDELIFVDLKSLDIQKLQLPKRSTDYSFLDHGLDHPYYTRDCSVTSVNNMEALKLVSEGKIDRIIDVRELEELDEETFEHFPLSKIRSEVTTLDIEGDVLFFCKSGVRSREASQILQGITNRETYSLNEAITSELKELWKNRK